MSIIALQIHRRMARCLCIVQCLYLNRDRTRKNILVVSDNRCFACKRPHHSYCIYFWQFIRSSFDLIPKTCFRVTLYAFYESFFSGTLFICTPTPTSLVHCKYWNAIVRHLRPFCAEKYDVKYKVKERNYSKCHEVDRQSNMTSTCNLT